MTGGLNALARKLRKNALWMEISACKVHKEIAVCQKSLNIGFQLLGI